MQALKQTTGFRRLLLILGYRDEEEAFLFQPNGAQAPSDFCYADFYNIQDHSSIAWKANASKNIRSKQVKFCTHSREAVEKVTTDNWTHSEPGVLGLLQERKDLFVTAIQELPVCSKIKVIQLGLHSFLDFCNDCEKMVGHFQIKIKDELLQYLETELADEYFLFSAQKQKRNRTAFIVNGINNRLYRYKPYYYEEFEHTFNGYFIQGYRPFGGRIAWRTDLPHITEGGEETRLLTYVNEPVRSGGDSDASEITSDIIPFGSAAAYWGYDLFQRKDFISDFGHKLNPTLLVLDLSGAQLGVNRDESDPESVVASHTNEVIDVLNVLRICPLLQHLNLSDNWIGRDQIIRELPNFLGRLSELKFLGFSKTCLTFSHNLDGLQETFKKLTKLTHIDLSHNGFDADSFRKLMGPLCAIQSPKLVDLSHNSLAHADDGDDIGCLSWIANFIEGNDLKPKVNLRNNGFNEIYFDWEEVWDEAGVSEENHNKIRNKIKI